MKTELSVSQQSEPNAQNKPVPESAGLFLSRKESEVERYKKVSLEGVGKFQGKKAYSTKNLVCSV